MLEVLEALAAHFPDLRLLWLVVVQEVQLYSSEVAEVEVSAGAGGHAVLELLRGGSAAPFQPGIVHGMALKHGVAVAAEAVELQQVLAAAVFADGSQELVVVLGLAMIVGYYEVVA